MIWAWPIKLLVLYNTGYVSKIFLHRITLAVGGLSRWDCNPMWTFNCILCYYCPYSLLYLHYVSTSISGSLKWKGSLHNAWAELIDWESMLQCLPYYFYNVSCDWMALLLFSSRMYINTHASLAQFLDHSEMIREDVYWSHVLIYLIVQRKRYMAMCIWPMLISSDHCWIWLFSEGAYAANIYKKRHNWTDWGGGGTVEGENGGFCIICSKCFRPAWAYEQVLP